MTFSDTFFLGALRVNTFHSDTFSHYIDTVSMRLSILCFKGSQFEFLSPVAFMSQIFAFIFENSADPDEMLHYTAFIMRHFIWVCNVCQSTCLQVSGIPIDRHPCDPFNRVPTEIQKHNSMISP